MFIEYQISLLSYDLGPPAHSPQASVGVLCIYRESEKGVGGPNHTTAQKLWYSIYYTPFTVHWLYLFVQSWAGTWFEPRGFLPGIRCDARVGLNLHLRHSPAKHTTEELYNNISRTMDDTHRLNLELDLQSLFGLHVHAAVLIGWGDPAFGLIYEGAIG